MKKTNRHLRTTKSFRFSPTLAPSVCATARMLNMTESEFVRKILMEALDRF